VKPNIEICSDPLSLAKQAAQMIATQAHQAVAANNRFIIAPIRRLNTKAFVRIDG